MKARNSVYYYIISMVSNGENLTRNFFKKYIGEEEVIYNFRPDWLVNDLTGKNLELDLWFPKFKLGVEFNGRTHKLDKQKQRDLIKKRKCDEYGVTLINVSHPATLLSPKIKELLKTITGKDVVLTYSEKCMYKDYKPKQMKGLFWLNKKIKSEGYKKIEEAEKKAAEIRIAARQKNRLLCK